MPNYPCRVKRIPSPVPDRAWYLRPWAIAAAGGLLPFGSIFIEMYFVFTSFWNYKVGGGRREGAAGLRLHAWLCTRGSTRRLSLPTQPPATL